eukprot:UN31528
MMVGKSGAGKTTLLNALCGIKPENYTIRGSLLMGRDNQMQEVLQDFNVRQQYISIMYQHDHLMDYYGEFTVIEILYWETFGLVPSDTIIEQADEVGIFELLDTQYKVLSGGQRVRVRLTVILLTKKPI